MFKIENLSLSYANNLLFKDFNLTLDKGEVAVLTGLSGSGKSSLLKVINGVIDEASEAKIEGKISFDGHDLLKEDITEKSKYLSTVFQNPKTQFYCINSTDELAFGLENRAIPRKDILETIDKYTTLLKTKDLLNKDIFSLSGGEKQLLAITAVTCLDNAIYLFDEPSASLDRTAIKRFIDVIKILKEQGKIILIAEHRLYYLKELMTKLVVIDDKKSYLYNKEEFLENYDHLKDKHHLRAINEINKNDLKSLAFKEIKLINPNIVQNESEVKNTLKCSNFKVKYDQLILDLSLSFSPGVYFIIGENGVGKSTFVKTLCKLIKSKGTRYYDNHKIKKSYDYISMVMQDVNYQIFTESLYEELAVISKDEKSILKALKEVNLDSKKDVHPQTLSGGEKQRLLIAKAKVSTKPIVILDEPTSGLDKLQMTRITNFLDEMKSEGKTLIVITHDYELIKAYKDANIFEFIH